MGCIFPLCLTRSFNVLCFLKGVNWRCASALVNSDWIGMALVSYFRKSVYVPYRLARFFGALSLRFDASFNVGKISVSEAFWVWIGFFLKTLLFTWFAAQKL